MFKYLRWLLHQLNDNCTSVLGKICKTRQVWGRLKKVATEGRGGAGSLEFCLQRGSSISALVWSGGMDAFCTNDAEFRVSACGFPVAGHRETVTRRKYGS